MQLLYEFRVRRLITTMKVCSLEQKVGTMQGEGFEPPNLLKDWLLKPAPLTRLGDPCVRVRHLAAVKSVCAKPV